MGLLEARPAGVARCLTHGGEYKILFWREGAPPVLPAASAAPATGVACVNHKNLPAVFLCRRCEAAVCDLCSFPQSDGSRLCPSCAIMTASEPVFQGGTSAVTLAVEGRTCPQHPGVAAVQICHICAAPMCGTCDFLLPGNLHVCPTCATKPQTSLSPKRKKLLIASFLLAAWCTVVLGALLSGMFRSAIKTKEDQEVLGFLLFLILLAPSIVGVSLAVASKERRLPNSIAMWVATAWNGVILGGFILLMIIGMMKG